MAEAEVKGPDALALPDAAPGDGEQQPGDEDPQWDAAADDAAAAGMSADEAEAADASRSSGPRRRRRTAAELNLLSDPQDIVVELTESVLDELSGAKKLHQLRYPTYIVCTHNNFQLRSVEGLRAIKGTALKELDLSQNKLMRIDSLEQFSTLKVLKVTHNLLKEVLIEKLPRLRHLDVSHNYLDGIPDLSGLKSIAHLDLSHNLIGTRPDSETSRDGWEQLKNAPLQQLSTLRLNNNKLNWDQQTFNEQVATLKEKKIRHLYLVDNPFVDETEGYRIWIISNCPKLIDLDGEKASAPRAISPSHDDRPIATAHERTRTRPDCAAPPSGDGVGAPLSAEGRAGGARRGEARRRPRRDLPGQEGEGPPPSHPLPHS